jgi:methylated-DNA-protein-cysteine methyltransferase-like protein
MLRSEIRHPKSEISSLEPLWQLVRSIPPGKVASYGALGKALRNPVSGLLVGKWMDSSPPDVPWWRVVGKRGDLLVARKGPGFAEQQERLLAEDGITLQEGRVDMATHSIDDEL